MKYLTLLTTLSLFAASDFKLAESVTNHQSYRSIVKILSFKRAASIVDVKTEESSSETFESAKSSTSSSSAVESEISQEPSTSQPEIQTETSVTETPVEQTVETAQSEQIFVEEPEQVPIAEASSNSMTVSSTQKIYTLDEFLFSGVINWNGYKFTYYSQSVLPGGGLSIPGRHVNADGYVSDGDGYIVLASDQPLGTVFDTPFGYQGKVYDRGVAGNHLDVYVR